MKRFALLMLVASLPGARALGTDSLQQPASVLPLSQLSAESLYCGEQILGSDYDPNDYEWRLQRAPVRMAQKPADESYLTDYLDSRELTELKAEGDWRESADSDLLSLNGSDVEVDESSRAVPVDSPVSGYCLPVDDFYASDMGPAGDYAGSVHGSVANRQGCCCGCGSGADLGCNDCRAAVPGCGHASRGYGCTTPSCGCR